MIRGLKQNMGTLGKQIDKLEILTSMIRGLKPRSSVSRLSRDALEILTSMIRGLKLWISGKSNWESYS